jgi:sirohydrochlorin ferrochelatase
MKAALHAPVTDRVRANTWVPVNDRLDIETQFRIREAAASASTETLTRRLTQLDYEWDFDRTLETEASLMGLLGLALGVSVNKRFLVVPAFVSAMLVVHATHGWYPLLPLFRRIGVRTQDEIDRERYGLKAIRGDFTALPPAGSAAAERAAAAWKAVCE